jgi:hypothetical protein
LWYFSRILVSLFEPVDGRSLRRKRWTMDQALALDVFYSRTLVPSVLLAFSCFELPHNPQRTIVQRVFSLNSPLERSTALAGRCVCFLSVYLTLFEQLFSSILFYQSKPLSYKRQVLNAHTQPSAALSRGH